MSSLRQARTRTSARNNAVNPPADANANAAVAATRGRNRSAAARAPAARRVVAPRPTAAGMRALQDALDAQRQEAEELREQMRQFIAENGNGGGGNENGQGGNGGGEGDQQRPDQEGDDEQDQGGGQGRDRDGQGDHNMEGRTGARSDNELGNFRMEVDAKFNAIMDAINKGSDGTPTGAQGANGNPSLGSNGLYGAFPGYQAGLPGMNGAAPWTTSMGPGAASLSGEYEISTHYTGLAKKELQAIMTGHIDPAKIYLAIPSDSDLYPRPDIGEKARMEVDEKGQVTLLDNSKAHQTERDFKRLVATLPDPLHFILAWSWFISLTYFHYKHAGLAAAMLRFGWKVISYARSNPWITVMRGFVKVATPLLQGHLLFEMPKFDNITFIEALGPYQGMDDGVAGLRALSTAGALAPKAKGVAGSSRHAANPKTPDGDIICISFNNGTCRRTGCQYEPVCSTCFGQHQASDSHAWNGPGYHPGGNQGNNHGYNDYSGGNAQKGNNNNSGGGYSNQQRNPNFANSNGDQGRWGGRNA